MAFDTNFNIIGAPSTYIPYPCKGLVMLKLIKIDQEFLICAFSRILLHSEETHRVGDLYQ